MANEPPSVVITEAAKKRLRRHKHAEPQILRSIFVLKDDPRAGHELTGKLHGYRSLKIFVKGSGEFRAIYRVVEEESTVVVHWIGTRENVYDEAERHLFG
jgi:mRNA-degrading endonuclease RelE of RelBE toxin-antitoxin system